MVDYGTRIHYQDPNYSELVKEAYEFQTTHKDARVTDDNIYVTIEKISEKDMLYQELGEKQQFLDSNDYQSAKCVEQLGLLAAEHEIDKEGKTADQLIAEVMDAEYPGLREKKQAYRARVREIRELLKDEGSNN